MVTTYDARQISISIARDWREVYDFAQPPAHFARWASGLATSLRQVGNDWIAESPDGPVVVLFTEPNDYGVLDHTLVQPDGTQVLNPMRVVANNTGAEVSFTLFRRPDKTDEDVERDAAWVSRDLNSLKLLLES